MIITRANAPSNFSLAGSTGGFCERLGQKVRRVCET